MIEKASENKPVRDERGRLLPGYTANPDGRKPDTPEDKIKKKAERDFIAEYKEKLREALPLVSPILIAKAMEGDMQAIKEVNDRVMGKPHQSVGVEGNVGLSITFDSSFKEDE